MRSWLAGALVLTACNGDDEVEPPTGERFEFQGAIHTVVVQASNGSVSLTASPGSVVAEFFVDDDGSSFQHSEDSGRLVLGSVCKDGSLGCGTAIQVTLPSGTDFEVETESGPVTFVGMQVIGDVVTNSGPITGLDLGPMILSTRSLTGDTTIEFGPEPVQVTMDGGSGGNLELTMPCGDYQLDTTAGGNFSASGCVQDGPSGPDIDMNTGASITITGV